ncbi:MAG: rSAM/selenodomain-associated transferase 2 [Cellvibrionaceae bacterium]|jgi:rSAM/selenodomain-associated transferase 2
MTQISIIIPVFNEASVIESQLHSLQVSFEPSCEIIVVDGGSTDGTMELAANLTNLVIQSKVKGRAAQMNAGAAIAKGRILLFLHSDTQLPQSTERSLTSLTENQWGFFPLKLSGKPTILRLIEKMINWRSRLSSIATGDQSLFIGRKLFWDNAGYADIPLMEDVDISKRLKKQSSPIILLEPVITSSRRWEAKGIYATILLMWRLRFLYFIGVPPTTLIKHYR